MKESDNEHFQAWQTPKYIFDAISEDYGPFDIDLFASEKNALCKRYFTETNSAFSNPWNGKNLWANPPYGAKVMKQIIKYASDELNEHRCDRVVILAQASISTKWFHEALRLGTMELFEGRIQFEREEKALQKDNSRISNVLIVLDRKVAGNGVTGTRSAKTGKLLSQF
jgi:site-specific DNA-methyltransferase (adenine-specific)